MGRQTVQKFTSDNTEGYSAADLAELNRRFDAAWAVEKDEVPERYLDEHRQTVAERVLEQFDTERAA
jgi:hypothetical protein